VTFIIPICYLSLHKQEKSNGIPLINDILSLS
jgi:hypothetical protein